MKYLEPTIKYAVSRHIKFKPVFVSHNKKTTVLVVASYLPFLNYLKIHIVLSFEITIMDAVFTKYNILTKIL